jgi:hypothetical protein
VTAVREGVARSQSEVHQHLLELGLVDPRDRSLLELARDVDVLREQAAQDRLEAAGHGGDVHGLEPQDLPPREGEQLPGQLGRPAGGRRDDLDAPPSHIVLRDLGQEDVGAADDGGHHVVEVVRDATGELADGLHLLRLPKLRLEHLARGDVVDERGRRAPVLRARQSLRPRRLFRPCGRAVSGRCAPGACPTSPRCSP